MNHQCLIQSVNQHKKILKTINGGFDDDEDEAEFDEILLDEMLRAERIIDQEKLNEHDEASEYEQMLNHDLIEEIKNKKLFVGVSENLITPLVKELEAFEDGAFITYHVIGYKDLNIQVVCESVRKFSYDKTSSFILERFIVAYDYLFKDIGTITNKKFLSSVMVMQRMVVGYVMNNEAVSSHMSEEQIRTIKRCILMSHAAFSRDTLNRAKTLALSAKTSKTQVMTNNTAQRNQIKAERDLHKCIAISVDSTTKGDQEIFCVFMRLVKGKRVYSMPLLLQEYKGSTDAKTLAKWLVDKITRLGLNCYRIINCTTDGASVCSGLDGGLSVEMNELINKDERSGIPLIDTEIKNFWCSAHRVALTGEGLDKEPEIKMLKILCQWFCRKRRLSDYNQHCQIEHRIKATYSFTRWCYIYKNVEDITNNYEQVANYLSTGEPLESLMTEFDKNGIVIGQDGVHFIKSTQKDYDVAEQCQSASDMAEEEVVQRILFNMNNENIKKVFFKAKEVFRILFTLVSSLQEDDCLLFEYVERLELFESYIDILLNEVESGVWDEFKKAKDYLETGDLFLTKVLKRLQIQIHPRFNKISHSANMKRARHFVDWQSGEIDENVFRKNHNYDFF
ncbi:hypothetical protein EIN_454800 [Entamoeba invadens IP1]|uniref:DUF4371 domain-containing protein n=1 Tax=Entamoeba invadens IP1 TaxID=370355 RepID=L7FLY7_ENTIV|nr:hypothetical protein EIN_454800 [Entamoeba invadens IP1]ELP89710.1 hypothetical protein EIN_454800 [Entamoeba invadens IP1]|eukprot:XP_004256481.1 hypothetical protein EIN_454800 [Entamoeba invadens IP1]